MSSLKRADERKHLVLNAAQKIQVLRVLDAHAAGSRDPWPEIGYDVLTERLTKQLGFVVSVWTVKSLCQAAGHSKFYCIRSGHNLGGKYGKHELATAIITIVKDMGSLASPELQKLAKEIAGDDADTQTDMF